MDATLVYDELMPRFAQKYRVEAIADGLLRRGFEVDIVPTSDSLLKAGVIVCDSYRTHADDLSLYRAERTVGLDDLTRDLGVDLLVSPNIGATPEVHRRARCVMAGPRYIPVNPQVIDYETKPPQSKVEKVLVAVDDERGMQIGSYIATQLADSFMDDVEINLLEDSDQKPNRSQISKIDFDSVTEVMAESDLVVCSGGSLMHEALALGRPTVAFAVSSVERRGVQCSEIFGVAIASEINQASVDAVKLAKDYEKRDTLFHVSRSIVDGLGAARIADEIARQMSLSAISGITSSHEAELNPNY